MSRVPEEARSPRPAVFRHERGPSESGSTPLPLEDDPRTAACVSACEGIPTSLLEDGFLTRLVAACLHVDDPRIQDVLSELVDSTRPEKKKRGN